MTLRRTNWTVSAPGFVMLVSCIAGHAIGQEIVVSPNSLADAEGNLNAPGSGQQTRVQMLFPASDFISLPETYAAMVALAWRPDQDNRLMDPISGPATIRLATTTADSLDSTFANNLTHSTGITEVFDGTITWQTNNDPPEGPRSFDDFTFQFQTPFTYDPTQGNLLVEFVAPEDWSTVGGDYLIDIHVSEGATNTTFISAADPSADVATFLGTGIIPTQFTFIPEPSTIMLSLLGTLGMACAVRRRR